MSYLQEKMIGHSLRDTNNHGVSCLSLVSASPLEGTHGFSSPHLTPKHQLLCRGYLFMSRVVACSFNTTAPQNPWSVNEAQTLGCYLSLRNVRYRSWTGSSACSSPYVCHKKFTIPSLHILLC